VITTPLRSQTDIQAPLNYPDESGKRILPLFLLWFFLGGLGAHAFYSGKTGRGVTYVAGALGIFLSSIYDPSSFLPLITSFVYGICLLIDFIKIVIGSYTDGNGLKITQWA
jgi:TM2 domain-containing membrane protein YozV